MPSPLQRRRYMMIPTKDDSAVVDDNNINNNNNIEQNITAVHNDAVDAHMESRSSKPWYHLSRQTYSGSLIFNLLAFCLPALYGTLSKLWVANIDSRQLATTAVYTYIGVVAEVLNEGLPRIAWVIIGDKSTRSMSSRIRLSYTLVSFQALLGAILTIIFVTSADRLAAAFVPEVVRRTSLTYVRISSVQALSSALQVSVASCTRALDHPDVPLVISSTSFVVNIVLDFLIISTFHVGSFKPSINTQAVVRMVCDLSSAMCGLVYFLFITKRKLRAADDRGVRVLPNWESLKTLVRAGVWTFLESALRNSIYLWLISGIVSMGLNYATAWDIFNTIRWGIFMVPVQALEASTLTFVGHAWGKWRADVGPEVKRPKASRGDIKFIARPAFVSCTIALIIEVPVCIILSFWDAGIKSFAFYLSQSLPVAEITQHMWKTIDWCYIFYAVNYQLAAILLATTPRWYLFQALGSNLLWMLPWAVAVTKIRMTPENAWGYDSIIFGGALVFSFFCVSLVLVIWAFYLMRGKIALPPVRSGT